MMTRKFLKFIKGCRVRGQKLVDKKTFIDHIATSDREIAPIHNMHRKILASKKIINTTRNETRLGLGL